MNIKEMKSKIQLAVEAVQDVPEPLKTKAFEIVLYKLLSMTEAPRSGESLKHTDTEALVINRDIEVKIAQFAQAAGISLAQVKDVFEFEEARPVFIGRVSGNEKEKQFQISRLILLAFKDVYSQEWIAGSILWKILKNYGVGSLANLAKNLTSNESEILAMGQRRDRKYKLTETGRQNALAALKQLVTG